MRKKYIIAGCVLCAILAVALLLWCGLSYYLVPRIVIPKIKEQVALFNRDHGVNLKVQRIYFLPLRGFVLKGIEFAPLFTAEEIDIDIDYIALLSRRIHLPRISVYKAKLNVSRSARGTWNFEPLMKSIFGKEKQDRPSFVDIDQVNFSRGQIQFNDQFIKRNRLSKRFEDVTLEIRCPDKEDVFVAASGADDKRRDAVRFEFNYSAKTGLIKGKAQLRIADLADYRDYYLDDLISPWRLEKAQLAARAKFSCCRGNISVEGDYRIDQGEINYGDVRLAGSGIVHQKGKSAGVELSDLSLLFEKTSVLEKGKCAAVVSDKSVQIKKLQGMSQGSPVDLKGQFVFRPRRRLDLDGRIGDVASVLRMKMLSDNSAQLQWQASGEASRLSVDAGISDIKELRFSGKVSGWIDLGVVPTKIMVLADKRHLTVSLEASQGKLKGRVDFSGGLQGELNRPETLFGKLGLKFTDFSLAGLEPLSFLLGMKVERGVFASGIPPMKLYRGKLSGAVALDDKRWGIELDIEDMDLAKFARIHPQLNGISGMFSGKAACVGRWGDLGSIFGGGKFNLQDADLKKVAIFSSAQQGVGSVVKGFQMPDFKEVTGNFKVTNEVVSFGSVMAKAPDMELRGLGTIDFSRRANFTLGVKFIQQRDLKTAMYIFFPLQTLGFDLLTKAVKVEIKGVIPELKQTTTVQPLGWLADIYGQQGSVDVDQYTLEKLWQ